MTGSRSLSADRFSWLRLLSQHDPSHDPNLHTVGYQILISSSPPRSSFRVQYVILTILSFLLLPSSFSPDSRKILYTSWRCLVFTGELEQSTNSICLLLRCGSHLSMSYYPGRLRTMSILRREERLCLSSVSFFLSWWSLQSVDDSILV
jgi:hypothetical protein